MVRGLCLSGYQQHPWEIFLPLFLLFAEALRPLVLDVLCFIWGHNVLHDEGTQIAL